MIRLSIIALLAAFAASPALAEKPEWAGKGKGKGHDKSEWQGKGKANGQEHERERRSRYFEDRHRVVVHEYFGKEYRRGHCPPGLAKKNNGCMPPGQAKKWRIGRPLPREVIFYDVPQPLVRELGAPPSGHRYVRVAADILLITVGTAMVVDAVQNLGRM